MILNTGDMKQKRVGQMCEVTQMYSREALRDEKRHEDCDRLSSSGLT